MLFSIVQADTMNNVMTKKLIHLPYFCISVAILLAFRCTPSKGLTEEDISFCISSNSSLAQTANCQCLRGGRGGRDGRSCGQSNVELVDLVCSGVSALDLPVNEIYSHITCLEITDSPELTELTLDQLKQFPNLEGLILLNTGLERIAENLSLAIPYVYDLHLLDGQLTRMPKLGGLKNLSRVSFARNKIEVVDRSRFVGATGINVLDLSGNQLTELIGNVFSGLCHMRRLSLGDNRNLKIIEDSVFDDTTIERLNLSYTQISTMPYTRHLEGWLSVLNLRGTPNLHTFNSHKKGGVLRGQSFVLLRDVAFNYNAHCCQLKRSNYSYYGIDYLGRKRETSSQHVFQRFYNYFFGRSQSSGHPMVTLNGHQFKDRYTRQTVPDENREADSITCLNYTNLNIVLFPTAIETTVTETTEEPITTTSFVCSCGSSQDCQDCVDFDCENGIFDHDCTIYQSQCDCHNQLRQKRNTVDNSTVEETKNGTADLPEGWFFHPNSTDLICTDNEIVNITTQVYRPCTDETWSSITPSHTIMISATTDISPTSTTLQTDTIPASSPLSTITMSEMTTPLPADSVTPLACSPSIVEVFCTLRAALTPPSTTMPPTTSAPTSPPCSCGGAFACEFCENIGCENPLCDIFSVCTENCPDKRRKRYTITIDEGARMKRDAADTLLPVGWFYPNPDNTTVTCILLSDNTTMDIAVTMTPESTTILPPSTVSVSSDSEMQGTTVCPTELFPLDGRISLRELSTVCSPLEDPFNPCEDLLGRDHVLRSFIWIMIILALVGNSLVIIVFLGSKHTKVELFVVDFFYVNLAMADFLMGVYLFTIAVQDLRTLDNFSMFDVAWRTEGGCDFAGFCAITSTVVSVYVLLVITAEQLYTFSRAMQKSHPRKTTAMILMAVGWGFGILMGILPVITNDVNDYSKTAICLPFDVSSKLALSYVLFLLLFTGVVFTAIAICYIIIFCQVFYCQKAVSVSDKKRWKIELKVALRMGTLVLTNFICWFPIALLGISAAVGNSLVNDITFAKWVMVFIFPINACLNPILYSILSKVFRDNLVLILGKCGLCERQVSKIRRHRAGVTSFITSNRSQVSSKAAGQVSESKGGGIIKQLQNFLLSSATNLLGRRSSATSQASSEERYQINPIRAHQRCGSSETILDVKVNSQYGSAISNCSMEEMTTFSNPGSCSSSPVGRSTVADGVAGNHKGSLHSGISLGAVPEENENSLSEIAVASGEGKQNPACVEE